MLICPQSYYCLGNYKHNEIHILHITEGNDILQCNQFHLLTCIFIQNHCTHI